MKPTPYTEKAIKFVKSIFNRLSDTIAEDKRQAVIIRQNLPKDATFRDIAEHNNIPRPDLKAPTASNTPV